MVVLYLYWKHKSSRGGELLGLVLQWHPHSRELGLLLRGSMTANRNGKRTCRHSRRVALQRGELSDKFCVAGVL